MMRALLDDKAAGRDGLADEFAKTIHRAVRVPRHVIEQVRADGR